MRRGPRHARGLRDRAGTPRREVTSGPPVHRRPFTSSSIRVCATLGIPIVRRLAHNPLGALPGAHSARHSIGRLVTQTFGSSFKRSVGREAAVRRL